jgi:hypothetical protein
VADISDVETALLTMAGAAVYPNGYASPSITGNAISIFRGWPNPTDLDAAVKAGTGMVSVFTKPAGSSSGVFQILNEDYLVVPPVHGMTISSISNGAVTVMGAPTSGEYLTIIVEGRNAYSRFGSDLPTILSAIAADASAAYPGISVFALGGTSLPMWSSSSGGGIQFPTDRLQAHIGSPAVKGRVTHRQKVSVVVTAWEPDPNNRDLIAKTVDAAIKAVNRLTFPDTSQGLLRGEGFIQVDAEQPAGVYRRDLLYSCEYATLQTYTAYEITSFTTTESAGAETTFVLG